MITKLMTTILFVIILSKLYAAIPVMLIFGIALKTILKNAPGYEKGAAINKWFAVVSEIFVFLMVFRFDISWMLIKGILLLCVFAYASYSDIKTREAANALSVMVFLIGFINVSGTQMLFNFIAAAIVFAFVVMCAIVSGGQLGGADIKFIPAAFFILGASRGMTGLIIGLASAVIGTLIRNKVTKINDPEKKNTLPLIPYLSAGFALTFLI